MPRAVMLLATLLGCASPGRGTDAPRTAVDASSDTRTETREVSWDPNDPCAPHRLGGDPLVAKLCRAKRFDGDCVGYCQRTAARTAMECLDDRGYPTPSFVALTHAKNPVTRTYARAVLLRRGALTLDLVREGLADGAAFDAAEGFFTYHPIAAEPAVIALLQRRDPESDALLAEFLAGPIAHELLRNDLEGGNSWSVVLAHMMLSVTLESWRSEATRAHAPLIERMIADAGEIIELDDAELRKIVVESWTADHECDFMAKQREAEARERRRILELEERYRRGEER